MARHRPRSGHIPAGAQAAGQENGFIKKTADLRGESNRIQRTRMAPCTGADQDQAIYPRFGCFFGMAAVDHIVEDQTAITVYRFYEFGYCAQGGNDQRDLVFDDYFQICLNAGIGSVNDQVDTIWRCFLTACIFIRF